MEITPQNLDKTFILTTGFEATEAAVKLARKYTGRKEVISFYGVGGKRSGRRGDSGRSSRGSYRPPFGMESPSCDLQCFKFFDYLVERATEREGPAP